MPDPVASSSPDPEQTPPSLRSAARPSWGYLAVFSGLLLQNFLLLALNVLLARLFGTSEELDAYAGNALALPIAISAIFTGVFGPLFITMRQHDADGNASAVAGLTLACVTSACCLLAIIGGIFPEQIMRAVHGETETEFVKAAAQNFQILVWLIPTNTLIGLFQSILNARLRFFLPAIAGVAGPLCTLAIVFVFAPRDGVTAVAWGTLGGALASIALQMPAVTRLISIRWTRATMEQLQASLGMALPIFIGLVLLRCDPIIDRAVCSELGDGRISQLRFAMQLVTVFLTLASGTLSTVSFPRIARFVGAEEEALTVEIRAGLRTLITLCLPAVAVLVVFPEALIGDLFQRGSFTASDTQVVATLARFYSVMLLGAALGELCAKTMYTWRDAVTPVMIGSSALLCGFLAKVLFVPRLGIVSLPVISSTVYLVSSLCLLVIVRRRTSAQLFKGLTSHGMRCGAAVVVAVAVGQLILLTGWPLASVIGLALGAIGYFATLAIIGGLAVSDLASVTGFLRKN